MLLQPQIKRRWAAVARRPLAALAKIVEAIDRERTTRARRAAAARLFGPAGSRIESLARRVSLVRTLATLEAIEVTPADIARGDARAAFEEVRPPLEAEGDPAKRLAILRGLFGGRGPQLFAAALVPEGIDHSWVFRYENPVPGS